MSIHCVMGTGSRSMRIDPNAQEIYDGLVRHIETVLLPEYGDRLWLISGMAEGWDEAVAKAAIKLSIPFIAAVPNFGYGKYYWGQKSVTKTNRFAQFQAILAHAAGIEYVCAGELYENGIHANFVRNSWMVNNSEAALVFEANSSGTKHAVALLSAAGKPFETYPFIKEEERSRL